MQSRAAIAGHPLHPLFVTIPIGLWSFALICDIAFLFNGDASWKAAAFYCIGGGIVGAIGALITGYIDYGIVKGAKAVAVAKFHFYLNLIISFLFVVSFGLRYQEFRESFRVLPVIITAVADVTLALSGWLGGELVSRFGVSVHRDAHERSGN